MKKHPLLIGLIFVLIITLCACNGSEGTGTTPSTQVSATISPPKPSYAGTMEGYEYFHTNERDKAWEEDVLYFAESFIQAHPYLANKNFVIYSAPDIFEMKTDYSNALYNEALYNDFVRQINGLIAQIPALTDTEIIFGMKSIVASLGDFHSQFSVIQKGDEVFPLFFEHITDDAGVSLYTICVPEEHEDLYLSKLIAINGVAVDEVLAKLRVFESAENEYRPIYAIVKPRSNQYSMLTLKKALQVIGVVEEGADRAAFTFETDHGTVTRELEAVTDSEYQQLTTIRHAMSTDERLLYKKNGSYWCEVLESGAVYVRFSAIKQDPELHWDTFLYQVLATVRSAEEPPKLIMDFRYNGGGADYSGSFKRFAEALNACTTDGVYIVINGGCGSAGVLVPYWLSRTVEDAILIGSPTAQFINSPANPCTYTLPNAGYPFYISSGFIYYAPYEQADALYPDVLLYQTWKDYVNCVDTVIAYILSVEE